MLEINLLSKSFGNVKALDNVSLRIEKGEFFGLLGPNGAGKTTLMNHIIGFLQADSGKITFNEEVIKYGDPKIKNNIGYVPQDIALYQELTAIQNLKIFRSFFKISKRELKDNIFEALELVQLSDRINSAVKDYSGGIKSRFNQGKNFLI